MDARSIRTLEKAIPSRPCEAGYAREEEARCERTGFATPGAPKKIEEPAKRAGTMTDDDWPIGMGADGKLNIIDLNFRQIRRLAARTDRLLSRF